MKEVFLNFDFYGAGNVGDDLMLEGFFSALNKRQDINFSCYLPRNSISQKIRFPHINFFKDADEYINNAFKIPIWVGVGDTPIQIASGDWLLSHLEKQLTMRKNTQIKQFYVGVGAQREAIQEKERFLKVLQYVDKIWTRDEFTTDFLINDFAIDSTKVSTMSDLANIALNNMDIGENKSTYDLGICYFEEKYSKHDREAIEEFIKNFLKQKNRCLLIANEIRTNMGFELDIYEKMFSFLERKFLFRKYLEYFIPNYSTEENIFKLINKYIDCNTVFSSRYHSILTAAWCGCKVVALSRSSAITSLAKELDIQQIGKPYTFEKLMDAYENAKHVDKQLLKKLSGTANLGMKNFTESIERL